MRYIWGRIVARIQRLMKAAGGQSSLERDKISHIFMRHAYKYTPATNVQGSLVSCFTVMVSWPQKEYVRNCE